MISFAAADPATGELRHERGDIEVPAASTIKLFVALAFWRSSLDPAEPVAVSSIPPAGSAGVAEYLSPRSTLTLGDLATLMLAVSDNAATNVLLARLGFDAVNAEIARLGLERTAVRRPMMSDGPENLTCARDLARGLAALCDPSERRAARPILAALSLTLDSALPPLLPAEVAVFAKTGELESVQHLAALLDDGRRRLAVAVCSSPPAPPHELAERASRWWARGGA